MILFYPNFAKKNIIKHISSSLEKIETTIKIFTNKNYSIPEIGERILKIESEITADITKFNRLVDEIRYESRSKIDYPSIFLHIRRISRLLNAIFQDLSNNDILNDKILTTSLNKLAEELAKIRSRLDKIDNLTIGLPFLEYSEQQIDHELIFRYATVNRIINETNELDKSLIQIGI